MLKILPDCQLCPRLAAFRVAQKINYPDYNCQPVAGFGDPGAPLLIVGLAPGLHGANASGRPFTGDASGDVLFRTLYRFGFSNHDQSRSRDDGLRLIDCSLTNAVKCVPPQNRPSGDEIRRCNPYLRAEITNLNPGSLILALGAIAHRSILKASGLPQSGLRFAHLAEHRLPGGMHLIDSYHCSRYNFNTGRLNQEMFDAVFERVRQVLA